MEQQIKDLIKNLIDKIGEMGSAPSHDCENGVAWLNEVAGQEFIAKYPETFQAMSAVHKAADLLEDEMEKQPPPDDKYQKLMDEFVEAGNAYRTAITTTKMEDGDRAWAAVDELKSIWSISAWNLFRHQSPKQHDTTLPT